MVFDQSNLKDFIEELIIHKRMLNELIKAKQKAVVNAPKGSLRIIKNRRTYQYYHRASEKDVSGKYIPRKDVEKAFLLAQKDYDIKLLKALTEQQKVIENFLKNYDPDAAVEVFNNLTEARKQLVKPIFLTAEEFIKQWQNEPYDRLGFGKDDPEYYTARGERVRSKSEILIADALYRHNIPYRYEYPVSSHGAVFAAPDFNCLNVRLRKEYYWEHLGMLGREDYADRNVKKIEKYTLADDFDETRLIITMESNNRPLNTKVVEEKIKRYLL